MTHPLTKYEFKYSLIEGFFPEVIPKNVFSTKNISKIFDSEFLKNCENDLKSRGIKSTPCFFFSIYKEETERRILGIPHITTYLSLSNYILENIDIIYPKIKNNEVSESKNIFLPYDTGESFAEIFKKRIWNSIGNKYILTLDISKCYENIYTHSIAWALLGKTEAKRQFSLSKDKRSTDYKIGDELDEKVRQLNNDETKGIPTGPITSRLISELILAEIDNILKKENLKYNRYVDDYRFYFLTKEEAIKFIPKFQRILHDYKLSINQNKTKIELFPDGLFTKDLKIELSKFDFKKYGIAAFINKFMELHNSRVKGAFKYGMKVLSSQKISFSERKYILSCLINSLIVFPKMSEVVIDVFEKNELIKTEDIEMIEGILNNLLSSNIDAHYDEEIFWNIYFMMRLNLNISNENISQILKREENFSTIMALDYIFKKKRYTEIEIKNELKELKEKLEGETIYHEKWLLIYEANFNGWIKGLQKKVNNSLLLKELENRKISFYKSPLG